MDELVNVPQDLTLVSDEDVQSLETQLLTEIARVNEAEVTPESLEYMSRLADDLERVKAENAGRAARVAAAAAAKQQALEEQRKLVMSRVNGPSEPEPIEGQVLEAPAQIDPEAIAAAAAQGATAALVAALGEGRGGGMDLARLSERATRSLAAAKSHAPAAVIPRPLLAVTAGVSIPGKAEGEDLNNIESLVDAFHRRARGMPITRDGRGSEQLVATIRNEFEHTMDDRSSPSQVEELFSFLTSRDRKMSLVAGGGWCAPSETRYDFFNIAGVSGLIDLPTFGVSRGGIRYPVSPSLADADLAPFDATFSNTSNPWLWTETDDQLTVTGSTNKPCIRVPCPTYEDRRLECYGVCLTAGNLTDDAFPENTRNFLRLMMAAHAHAMNQRIISTMVTLSSAVVSGGDFAGATTKIPVYNQVLGGVSLAAADYRARYGMGTDDVLEVVLPYWLAAVIQADLAWRRGAPELLSVTIGQINGYFADRGVRVQWVNDWQVRGTGQFGTATAMNAWPTTVDIMMYAAGTFLLGNGLTLDLGVVRDSVLNAENDHTAAWSEECHLVAKVGHESRQYRIGFAVNGAASADVALADSPHL